MRVHFLAGGRVHSGDLFDLSATGLFVATGLDFSRGTGLVLEIELPDGKPSEAVRAVVVRSRPSRSGWDGDTPAGLGLAFMTDSTEEALSHLLVATTTLTFDLLG